MFRSILCPVDFSAHSERALGCALELAALCGAQLTIMTAVDPFMDVASNAAGQGAALTQQTQDEVQQLLGRLGADRHKLTSPPAIAVVTGEPGEQIAKQAAECAADLVVMGTKGLGAAKRLVFGSVTESVLRESKVPVLAVPRPE